MSNRRQLIDAAQSNLRHAAYVLAAQAKRYHEAEEIVRAPESQEYLAAKARSLRADDARVRAAESDLYLAALAYGQVVFRPKGTKRILERRERARARRIKP